MNSNAGEQPKPEGFQFIIDGRRFTSQKPALTGRELLGRVDRDPERFFLTFHIEGQPDEIVELDEPFDLSAPTVEEFVLISKDRHFTIQIDEGSHRVVGPYITGLQILSLEGKDPNTHFVTQILPGIDDIEVEPGMRVDLSKPGVERFTVVARTKPKVTVVATSGYELPMPYDPRESVGDLVRAAVEELGRLGQLDPSRGYSILKEGHELEQGSTLEAAGVRAGDRLHLNIKQVPQDGDAPGPL